MQLAEPVAVWYLPVPQATHDDDDVAEAYFPAAHDKQALAPDELYFPEAHASVHAEVRPVAELYFPALQAEHDDSPDDDAYVPTAQLVQLDAPAAEYLPRAHASVQAVLRPVALL